MDTSTNCSTREPQKLKVSSRRSRHTVATSYHQVPPSTLREPARPYDRPPSVNLPRHIVTAASTPTVATHITLPAPSACLQVNLPCVSILLLLTAYNFMDDTPEAAKLLTSGTIVYIVWDIGKTLLGWLTRVRVVPSRAPRREPRCRIMAVVV